MYLTAFLAEELASIQRRDRLAEACRVRIARRAKGDATGATSLSSVLDRIATTLRPAPDACQAC